MGLKDTVKQGVSSAFSVLTDFHTSVTITYVGTPTYDPVTGELVSNNTTAVISDAIITEFKQEQVNGILSGGERESGAVILATDRLVLIQESSLTTIPNIDDEIAAGGVTYEVKNVMRDPANAVVSIHVRRGGV